jgi:hypothetical protein
MENLHLKNLKIDKSNLFFINYSIKQLIYQDDLMEIDFFNFLKDTYLNYKNKKIIYYIYEQTKTNKVLLEYVLTQVKYDTINKELKEQYQLNDYNGEMNDLLANALSQTIIFEHIFEKNEIDKIYKTLKDYYYINDNKDIETSLFISEIKNVENELNNILNVNKQKLITSKDKEYLMLTYYKLTSDPYDNNTYLWRKMCNGYHIVILKKLEELNLIKLDPMAI